jgi:hypothetical protein
VPKEGRPGRAHCGTRSEKERPIPREPVRDAEDLNEPARRIADYTGPSN